MPNQDKPKHDLTGGAPPAFDATKGEGPGGFRLENCPETEPVQTSAADAKKAAKADAP